MRLADAGQSVLAEIEARGVLVEAVAHEEDRAGLAFTAAREAEDQSIDLLASQCDLVLERLASPRIGRSEARFELGEGLAHGLDLIASGLARRDLGEAVGERRR